MIAASSGIRRWTLVVAAVLATLLAVLAGIAPQDGDADYFETAGMLRQLKEADARCEADILRARIGLDSNYDAIADSSATVQSLVDDIAVRLGGLSFDHRVLLGDAARGLRAVEADKAALVERFKSENSILRNSLAFLPTAESDLRGAIQSGVSGAWPDERAQALAAHARQLLLASLVNAQGASAEGALQVERETAALQDARERAPEVVARRVDLFVAHARTTLVGQQTVRRLIGQIAVLTTANRIEEIGNLLAADQRAAHARLHVYRTLLLAFAAVVLALFLWAAVRLAASQASIALANGALQEANATLERRVEERTAELRRAQQAVVETAHKAGMAEIATNVLHNVGNVLNGVNVSVATIVAQLRGSRLRGIRAATALMEERSGDLDVFLCDDPQGRQVPAYVVAAVRGLEAEHRSMLDESMALTRSVDHLKEIVAAQQAHASGARLVEPVAVCDLVDEALRMNAPALHQQRITIEKCYEPVPVRPLDRVRIVQILVNLIRNAGQAMATCREGDRYLTLGVSMPDGRDLCVSVGDNGIGIASENLARIFAHGYTTKTGGHGFGLHGAAVAAREMGGRLEARSDGSGKGATFTLHLACEPLGEAA